MAFVFLLSFCFQIETTAQSKSSLNVDGEWLWYVGPRKIPYKVFIKTHYPLEPKIAIFPVSGYMIAPNGKRFDFISCSKSFDESCSLYSEGNGRTAIFSFYLREGETIWKGDLLNNKFPKYYISGEARHYKSNKLQAIFVGNKL